MPFSRSSPRSSGPFLGTSSRSFFWRSFCALALVGILIAPSVAAAYTRTPNTDPATAPVTVNLSGDCSGYTYWTVGATSGQGYHWASPLVETTNDPHDFEFSCESTAGNTGAWNPCTYPLDVDSMMAVCTNSPTMASWSLVDKGDPFVLNEPSTPPPDEETVSTSEISPLVAIVFALSVMLFLDGFRLGWSHTRRKNSRLYD
jgi:hypothetical protein